MSIVREFKDEYDYLSNFHNTRVEVCGIVYLNAEAAYQAGKTLSLDARRTFTHLNGAQAKKAGRGLTLRPDWDQVKEEVMELVLRAKFMGNKQLAQKLVSTDTLYLQEGNWWNDKYWGVYLGDDEGDNRLGILLMNIREELKLWKGR